MSSLGTRLDRRKPLKVYPQAEYLRTLARPMRTQVFAGNQVAREKGDGIEFADLRPFAPGDLSGASTGGRAPDAGSSG